MPHQKLGRITGNEHNIRDCAIIIGRGVLRSMGGGGGKN